MYQSKPFSQTRWRLTGWYVGVMGVILGLCGFVFYEMIAQARWGSIHQELTSVSGTLHDGLEPVLKHPGHLEPEAEQLLPGICMVTAQCSTAAKGSERHILGAVQQAGYYVRFLDLSGKPIATLDPQPDDLPISVGFELWQTLEDRQGRRYHQISLLLKTANQLPWGYMQIGQSLQEHDEYLATLRLMLLLGIPVAMLFISAASWGLAGLAMQPVYQSYRQIQQFTADAAHELRTPLAATRATVEAVLDLEIISESESRSTLQTLARQNLRLSQLVQDLLLLSRLDSQRQPLKQSCDLKTLICDVMDEFEVFAGAAGIELIAKLQMQQSLFVLGDEEQLYRLMANLVGNAIHYTPKGGQVWLTLDREDRHALIRVQDTGIGIACKEQSHIFERFYRVNSDRSRATGGSGLGLPIAMAIAKAHHGTIQVKSQVGQGSLFTVRLPQHHESSRNARQG
jgi:signal transduction histidine kinase